MRIKEPDHTLAAQVKKIPLDTLHEMVADWKLKTAPMLHQSMSITLGIDQPNFIFGIDMGLGKSKIALDIFTIKKRLGDAERLLVIAPPPIIWHWGERRTRRSQQAD